MKRVVKNGALLILVGTILSGCDPEASPAQRQLDFQNEQKMEQAVSLSNKVKIPDIDLSLERQNIVDRTKALSDPSKIMWLYVLTDGVIIDRVPVRGKVTNGSKRLTSATSFTKAQQGGYINDVIVEAPDEVGVYGTSGDFVFWFDPKGDIYQTNSSYYLKPHPYKYTDKKILSEIDQNEESKIPGYKKQIHEYLQKMKQEEEKVKKANTHQESHLDTTESDQ